MSERWTAMCALLRLLAGAGNHIAFTGKANAGGGKPFPCPVLTAQESVSRPFKLAKVDQQAVEIG